jgi:hypothetical protein
MVVFVEGKPMKLSFRTVVLASSALCATAAFAANQARVDVPFAFTAKGQTFPAGSYRIALSDSHTVLTMASQSDVKKQISWVAGAGEKITAPGKVVFDVQGDDYALKTIQVGSRITPNLDKRAKAGVSATTSIAGQ